MAAIATLSSPSVADTWLQEFSRCARAALIMLHIKAANDSTLLPKSGLVRAEDLLKHAQECDGTFEALSSYVYKKYVVWYVEAQKHCGISNADMHKSVAFETSADDLATDEKPLGTTEPDKMMESLRDIQQDLMTWLQRVIAPDFKTWLRCYAAAGDVKGLKAAVLRLRAEHPLHPLLPDDAAAWPAVSTLDDYLRRVAYNVQTMNDMGAYALLDFGNALYVSIQADGYYVHRTCRTSLGGKRVLQLLICGSLVPQLVSTGGEQSAPQLNILACKCIAVDILVTDKISGASSGEKDTALMDLQQFYEGRRHLPPEVSGFSLHCAAVIHFSTASPGISTINWVP